MKIKAPYTPSEVIAAMKDWSGWTTPKNPNRYIAMLKPEENSPVVEIIFCQEYVRFSSPVLTADERKLLFPYCDYNEAQDFAQYLSDFIEEVSSTLEAEVVWTRKVA